MYLYFQLKLDQQDSTVSVVFAGGLNKDLIHRG